MFPHDKRLIDAIHADRIRPEREAIQIAALGEAATEVARPHPLRRAVGRSLVAVGSRLAAEPPSRPPVRAR